MSESVTLSQEVNTEFANIIDREFDAVVPEVEALHEAELSGFTRMATGNMALRPFAPGEMDTEQPGVVWGCFPLNSDSDTDGGHGRHAIV